jgi:glutaryl-CoA dehydrogenase
MTNLKELRKIFKLLKNVNIKDIISFIEKNPKLLKSLGKQKHIPANFDSDFYNIFDKLSEQDNQIRLKVRNFMETEVKPIINYYWYKDEFPHELIPKLRELDICGLSYKGYGCQNKSFLLEGVVAAELSRIDPSLSTFFGVHSGLVMGSIYLCGSEEQKNYWLPKMRDMEVLGSFGLTEPLVGSGAAGGLNTTCEKKDGKWILNGQKKWIGNSTFSDINIIWARDISDNNVKGFIVEADNPGFSVEKIEGKISLKIVQNGLITLNNCIIEEENRLQNANSFKDTSKVLKMTRAGVAWQSVGLSMGAYETTVKYCNERKQFGKTIDSFQLTQSYLANMLGDLTAMQNMVFRLSQLQDNGTMNDQQASLAKVWITKAMRRLVSTGRELFGGNGILLEYDIAKYMADSEALYSYEGTAQINELIVGRSITGKQAFI